MRVAVAGVGVGDHRDRDRTGDAPGVVDHLGHRQQPHVGLTEARRSGPEARHVRGREPGLGDEPRAERVEATGREHHLLAREQ